jgi:hypothetical protein
MALFLFAAMNEQTEYTIARRALKKLYPSWHQFIDEVMNLIYSFWLGIQSKEEVHFIHLIGYGKRQKAREIITDLLELLDWQSESVFLWQNWDHESPSPLSQVVAFQEAYQVFPKVVVTDFLSEYLAMANGYHDDCFDFPKVGTFLRERKDLQLCDFNYPASNARGSLVISFLDSFGDSDFVRSRVFFQFIWGKPGITIEYLRKIFVPEDLHRLIEEGSLKREELIFFSNDEPRQILLAIALQKVTLRIEEQGTELLGSPVKLTIQAMDYFLAYIFYQKLSDKQLRQAALDFFLPVFRQFPKMINQIQFKPKTVQLDFHGGWKFKAFSE